MHSTPIDSPFSNQFPLNLSPPASPPSNQAALHQPAATDQFLSFSTITPSIYESSEQMIDDLIQNNATSVLLNGYHVVEKSDPEDYDLVIDEDNTNDCFPK